MKVCSYHSWVCWAVLCLAGSAQAQLLPALAPDALVVVGDSATPAERQAAEALAKELQKVGGAADNLVLASQVNANLELAASKHLLVVGTDSSNRILQRLPSHWALNRDAYYQNHQPTEPYLPTRGFYAAGYGTFSGGAVGYIECDRNPYWHYATNILIEQTKDVPNATLPKLPYRQIIRLTGNTPDGVTLAVRGFMTQHLLTGIVTPDSKLPDPMSLWTIDTAHLALPEVAPKWIPQQTLQSGATAVVFAGWHLADSMTYAGFQEDAGVAAQKIWRAKYLTESKWDYPATAALDPAHAMTRSPLFEASLARRASDQELFVAQTGSAQEARNAVAKLKESLSKNKPSHDPWTAVTIDGIEWQRSKFGVHITASGPFVVMESFKAPHETLMLKTISAALHSGDQVRTK